MNFILQKYTITKDGKTISIDNEENWSYVAPKISVGYAKNGEIDYSLTGLSHDGMKATPAPILKYDTIIGEVEEVKKMIKTL